MSIFSSGPVASAPDPEITRERWWTWNPARPKPSVATPAEVAEPERWWAWNPYRNSVARAQARARRLGYQEGVRDEVRVVQRRRKRKSHPLLALTVLAAAVGGVGFVGLAFDKGSFSAGGAVVDQKIAEWRSDISNGGATQAAQPSTQTPPQSGG